MRSNVKRFRPQSELARYLAEPETMLAEGDPIATDLFDKYQTVRMPDLRLGGDDISAVVSYMEAQSGVPRQQARKDSALAQ